MIFRSMMLVTGGREAVLNDALASAADAICVDLEDTVEDKAVARSLAERFLGTSCQARKALRINGIKRRMVCSTFCGCGTCRLGRPW